MSGSRWMTTPSWLSGSLKSYLYSSVYSYHFLHFFCFCEVPAVSFIVPISAWNWYLPIFLKKSLVFPILLFSSISLHCLPKKAFLSLLAVLWNSTFGWEYLSLCHLPLACLRSQLFVRCPQTTILPSCISSSLGWFWSPPPIQCYKPPSTVLQAPYLPDLIPWIYSSPPLYNHKGFDLDHTWIP